MAELVGTETGTELLRVDPGWLGAVAPEGLVFVGPDVELEIGFEADFELRLRALEEISTGTDGTRLAAATGSDPSEAESLLKTLRAHGALTAAASPQPPRGTPLLDAILEVGGSGELQALVWTAEEALLAPDSLDSAARRNLLRAFVGGLEPIQRLRAYSYAARWMRPSVRGDVPADGALEAAELRAEELDGAAIHVLSLTGGQDWSLTAEELTQLDGERSHRLGPVRSAAPASGPAIERLGLAVHGARHSISNLRFPDVAEVSWCKGIAPTRELAERIARAEAVERYVCGSLGGRELIRARADQLEDAVPGDLLLRLNQRQYAEFEDFEPYDANAAYLWTPAMAPGGERRWVPAEAVFFPFEDTARPTRVARCSSSGVAAHTDPAEARTRAFRELVERDAFMWTWAQRISRERIDPRGVGEPTAAIIATLARDGFKTEFVNLTLDTKPVVLCAVHDAGGLYLGAACNDDPAAALAKALEEAATLVAVPEPEESLDPSDVDGPVDHLNLYRNPEFRREAEFLFASEENIEPADVTSRPEPISELLEKAVGEPLIVDLSCDASGRLTVCRALVPGSIPMSFGFDREPLGTPRLATPISAADGRRLGGVLDLDRVAAIMPHPFA